MQEARDWAHPSTCSRLVSVLHKPGFLMTVFEYLMVMTSIVLAVTLTQLLRGLTDTWRSPTRHTPHVAWIIVLSFMTVQMWWAFWELAKT